MWGALNSALNSNVGQSLVTAGAEVAIDKVFSADGFDGEEVNSPTAAPISAGTVAAIPAATTTLKTWPLVAALGLGAVVLFGVGAKFFSMAARAD